MYSRFCKERWIWSACVRKLRRSARDSVACRGDGFSFGNRFSFDFGNQGCLRDFLAIRREPEPLERPALEVTGRLVGPALGEVFPATNGL